MRKIPKRPDKRLTENQNSDLSLLVATPQTLTLGRPVGGRQAHGNDDGGTGDGAPRHYLLGRGGGGRDLPVRRQVSEDGN